MPETVRVSRERVTLDLLLFRKHGTAGRALLSKAYALNPRLAEKGVVLPPGTMVELPDLDAETVEAVPVIDLFS